MYFLQVIEIQLIYNIASTFFFFCLALTPQIPNQSLSRNSTETTLSCKPPQVESFAWLTYIRRCVSYILVGVDLIIWSLTCCIIPTADLKWLAYTVSRKKVWFLKKLKRLYFLGLEKSLQMVTAAMKLKDVCSLEEKLWQS